MHAFMHLIKDTSSSRVRNVQSWVASVSAQGPVLATHTGDGNAMLLPIVIGLAITHEHSKTHSGPCHGCK